MNKFLYILFFCGQMLFFNNTFAQTTETIAGNTICCYQVTSVMPYDPSPIGQISNATLSSNIAGATFTYLWQESLDGFIWTDIPGSTQASFDPPLLTFVSANLFVNRYRRVVQSSFGAISYSGEVPIIKAIEIVGGNTICCSQTSAVPFVPAPFGQEVNTSMSSNIVTSTFAYQWQKSINNVWTDISGATNASYNPPFVSGGTVNYRRMAVSSLGNPSISNEVSIKIDESIIGNSICCAQKTAVFPFDPAPFNQSVNTQVRSTEPGATFTYQWQKRTNNVWADISGATQASYDPSSMYATYDPVLGFDEIKYRRVVQSSLGATSISNEVPIIKIEETTFGNDICCRQLSAVPFTPATLNQRGPSASSTQPGATFTFQWQTDINGAWADIPGATNVSYNPPFISTGVNYYRRLQLSSFGTLGISNEVDMMIIDERILDNSICCSQTTALSNYDAAPFKQTANTTVRSSIEDATPRLTYQWQQSTNGTWTNISGATQASYDYGVMPATATEVKFRRVVKSPYGTVSTSNEVAVNKVAETILDNSICCSQTTSVYPFDPAQFNQSVNTTVRSTAVGATLTYQWQQSTTNSNVWINITAATGSTFDPPLIGKNLSYRRVVTSSYGTISISNVVTVSLKSCSDRPNSFSQTICGNMAYYQLQHGDVINIGTILGSYDAPGIRRREYGFDYMVSLDEGKNWINAKPKELLSYDSDSPYNICSPGKHSAWDLIDPNIDDGAETCAIKQGILDYQLPAYTFDINKGAIQHIYIRRDYYEWYDPFNCWDWDRIVPGPCGSRWYLKAESNVVVITLTSGGLPQPVAPITSSQPNATCVWDQQTITFSVPKLNNGEYYKWTIPSVWTSYNNPLEGGYLNEIKVSTNSGDANYAKGGQVCLEVTQGAQKNRQCISIPGTAPTTINMPTTIRACEGETVVITPIIRQGGLQPVQMNPADYDFLWTAYQSQNINCGNPALNNCKSLSLVVSNVQQNPTQNISVRVRDKIGCIASASTTLIASPGWQMGILNSYDDPLAKSTSTLGLDEANNYLYFVQNNGTIVRSYFDNGLAKWQYVTLKDKTNNAAIKSDGPVAVYKGATYKLFYVLNKNLYYCESTDNGQTWVNNNNVIVANIDSRIKVDGDNIYYIASDRWVYSKPIANTNTAAKLVGNVGVNYSPGIFTVEDGVLAYADQSYNMVAFNALTGSSYPINVTSGIKQVTYNSTISVYSGNIYFANGAGTLIILKKNASTGVYDTYEEVKNLKLAGPLTINKQTGTVYAGAYDVEGKQIYYLNGQWQVAPIRAYANSTGIQSGMVYGNGHAYYISSGSLISNTFYIAPCVPAVLRTTGDDYSQTGDVKNDPLLAGHGEEPTMVIYPNPTNSQIKATFSIWDNSTVRVNIIPITGGFSDELLNTYMESGTHELSLDLSSYSNGVYLIQLYVNGSLYTTSKVVKF